jgi:hypothetical protein
MAATAEAARLTEAHRRAQGRLAARLALNLADTWTLLDPADIDATLQRWLRVTLPVVRDARRASAVLAGDYLPTFRALEIGTIDGLTVRLTDSLDTRLASGSLIVDGPGFLRSATARGALLTTASEKALANVARSATRLALDGSRGTILGSIETDRRSLGWARATSGKACAFCAMLAARGPVYRSEGSSSFDPHKGCNCHPEAVYREDADWPTGADRYRGLWDRAQAEARAAGELNRGTSNDALNAFRRLLATDRPV